MTSHRNLYRRMIMCAFLACMPCHAQAAGFLGLSIGYFNAFDGDKNSATFRAELIPESTVFLKSLKPWGGVEVTTNLSAWIGGGLLYDIPLNKKLTLTPSLGAGFYHHGSGDIDLGYPVEFRTQLALNYAINDQNRIGLAFSHMSNAGLDDDNAGTETIALTYTRALKTPENQD